MLMPFFAGGTAMNQLFKTALCKHFEQQGRCNIGAKCHFAHGKHELRGKEDVSARLTLL